jgi:hypothetical protein
MSPRPIHLYTVDGSNGLSVPPKKVRTKPMSFRSSSTRSSLAHRYALLTACAPTRATEQSCARPSENSKSGIRALGRIFFRIFFCEQGPENRVYLTGG